MTSKYHEEPLGVMPPLRRLNPQVEPPRQLGGPRRRSQPNAPRTASPNHKQLVVTIADRSKSMEDLDKYKAEEEAAAELIFACKRKNRRASIFDLAIYGYGTHIDADEGQLLRPVHEIDEELLDFTPDCGGTDIYLALEFAEALLQIYDEKYLRLLSQPERAPRPLIILLSDGHDGGHSKRCPTEVATRIKEKELSIGVTPMIVTLGIEFDDDGPNVELMQRIASRDDLHGQPLYFDASDRGELVRFLAAVGSSCASSPADISRVASLEDQRWKLPSPKGGK